MTLHGRLMFLMITAIRPALIAVEIFEATFLASIGSGWKSRRTAV